MKSYYLSILFFLCIGLQEAIAQKRPAITEITAVRLKEHLISTYQKVSIEAFSVDEKGIVRPQKSYRMYYLEQQGKVIVSRNERSALQGYSGGYEEVPLPDDVGLAVCMCNSPNDNCKFKDTSPPYPDPTEFSCAGSCDCGVWVVLDPRIGIAEYQSDGGGWSGF